ncbi:MAG TPA: hypothetical protein DCQ30_11235 [Acidimicrobiaceae bacterium]|nr:hypothetical protein [Acidimicrobiaceae bacterium]
MDGIRTTAGRQPAPPRRRSFVALGALGAVLAVVVAACGSGPSSASGGKPADPRRAVLASVTTTESARSAAFDFSVSVNGSPQLGGLSASAGGGTTGPIALTIGGHGQYSFADRAGETTITLPAIGQAPAQTVQVREIGDELYLSTPRLSTLDGGKPWVSVNLSDYEHSQGQSNPLGNLSLGDPSQALALIKQLAGSVTEVGTSDLDGVPTTEYAATVDLAGSGTTSSTLVSPQIAQALGLSSVPIDVWVDDQGRARQEQTSFSVLGLTVKALVHLGSFGTPVSIPAPPPDQVADGSTLLHNGQLGSLFAPTT